MSGHGTGIIENSGKNNSGYIPYYFDMFHKNYHSAFEKNISNYFCLVSRTHCNRPIYDRILNYLFLLFLNNFKTS